MTATLSLAVGIGATTLIFTVANGPLLRAAAGVTEPDRLVNIARIERGDTGVDLISYPDLLDLRRRMRTVDQVYAYQLELEPISVRVAREEFRGISVLAPDLWIPAGMVDVAQRGSQRHGSRFARTAERRGREAHRRDRLAVSRAARVDDVACVDYVEADPSFRAPAARRGYGFCGAPLR